MTLSAESKVAGFEAAPPPTREQLRAVEAGLGPVLVVAGPGAGKTFCLINRIGFLIPAPEISL